MASQIYTTATTTIVPGKENPAMPSLPMAKVDSVMNDSPGSIPAPEPAPMYSTVRIVKLHEYKAAALSLAEAFRDDHVSRYFLDTPERATWSAEQKWTLHLKIMEYITYAHLLQGLVLAAGPNYDCVALWMPPGRNMDDLATICRSGLWRLYYELGGEGRRRFFNEFFPLLHDTKAAVLAERDEESWYLVYIGTRPEGRGKGYARKVVDYVTQKADEEGRACYLESSNEVNRKIYGKMGFELQKHIYLQRAREGTVVLDIMVREAKEQ